MRVLIDRNNLKSLWSPWFYLIDVNVDHNVSHLVEIFAWVAGCLILIVE